MTIAHKTLFKYIEELKRNTQAPDLQELGLCMEEFLKTYDRRSLVEGPDELETYIKELTDCQSRLTASFTKMCERTNMTVEQFTEYTENPKNFSVEQWEELQELKGRNHLWQTRYQ